MTEPITLHAHVEGSSAPDAAELAVLLGQLAVAGTIVARELARAALVGQLGPTGITNVQGEAVKKLDAWANDVVVRALEATGLVSALVSEESDEPIRPAARGARGGYVVCVDPVDGSSNLDVNGIVGTIFSTRRSRGPGDDTRQPGTAALHGALRRLARRRLSPHTARRRDLSLPARGEPSVGEAPPPIRVGAHGLPRRAGGRPREHRTREIMTIDAATPHARVPLVIGSPDDVAMAEDFIGGRQWRRSG